MSFLGLTIQKKNLVIFFVDMLVVRIVLILIATAVTIHISRFKTLDDASDH